MAIQPISAVLHRNNYNSVSFAARKKKNDNPPSENHSTSSRMAKPIAAMLLAASLGYASPINAQSPNSRGLFTIEQSTKTKNELAGIEGKIVGSKSFSGDRGQIFTVYLMDLDEEKVGFNKILLSSKNSINAPSMLMEVEEPSIYSYKISSEDGSAGEEFELRSVKAKLIPDNDPESFASKAYKHNPDFQFDIYNEDMANYIEKHIMTGLYNSEKHIKKYNRVLRPTLSLELQNGPFKNNLQDAVPKKSYGVHLISQPLETECGEYNIGYYSSTGDPNIADVITVSKDKGKELQVVLNAKGLANFPTNDKKQKNKAYGITIVKGQGNSKYILSDLKLAAFLETVYKRNDVKKSIFHQGDLAEYKYRLADRGEVLPVMNIPEEKGDDDGDDEEMGSLYDYVTSNLR